MVPIEFTERFVSVTLSPLMLFVKFALQAGKPPVKIRVSRRVPAQIFKLSPIVNRTVLNPPLAKVLVTSLVVAEVPSLNCHK